MSMTKIAAIAAAALLLASCEDRKAPGNTGMRGAGNNRG